MQDKRCTFARLAFVARDICNIEYQSGFEESLKQKWGRGGFPFRLKWKQPSEIFTPQQLLIFGALKGRKQETMKCQKDQVRLIGVGHHKKRDEHSKYSKYLGGKEICSKFAKAFARLVPHPSPSALWPPLAIFHGPQVFSVFHIINICKLYKYEQHFIISWSPSYNNITNFVSCIWCFVTCSYWLMEDRCIPKNIYICKFKVVIILLYNLFQLFNVYGLSPPIYAICPLASPYFTVPNIDYFWRVIKYAVKQSLSGFFHAKLS